MSITDDEADRLAVILGLQEENKALRQEVQRVQEEKVVLRNEITDQSAYVTVLVAALAPLAPIADQFDTPAREGGSIPTNESVVAVWNGARLTVGDLRRARDTLRGIRTAATLAKDVTPFGSASVATGEDLDRLAATYGLHRQAEETDDALRARAFSMAALGPQFPARSPVAMALPMGQQAKQTLDNVLRDHLLAAYGRVK